MGGNKNREQWNKKMEKRKKRINGIKRFFFGNMNRIKNTQTKLNMKKRYKLSMSVIKKGYVYRFYRH